MMPQSPEDMKKYEEMLMDLASEYPELEEEAINLSSAILDLDAPDIADEDAEMMEADMALEEEPELDAEIPPELLDEEEDMEDEEEDEEEDEDELL
jgi:hypothetical protein